MNKKKKRLIKLNKWRETQLSMRKAQPRQPQNWFWTAYMDTAYQTQFSGKNEIHYLAISIETSHFGNLQQLEAQNSPKFTLKNIFFLHAIAPTWNAISADVGDLLSIRVGDATISFL